MEVNRSSYRYWLANDKVMSPQRLRLISELERLFGLSNQSAGQRSLVKLLGYAGFTVSRWLVRKLMRQEGLISRQLPSHRYAKAEKAHTLIPNVLGRQFQPPTT